MQLNQLGDLRDEKWLQVCGEDLRVELLLGEKVRLIIVFIDQRVPQVVQQAGGRRRLRHPGELLS